MADLTPVPENKKKHSTVTNIPRADTDLMEVAKLVDKSWLQNPQLTLIWISQPVYSSLVTNYSDTLMQRKSAGGSRPEVTGKLKVLDDSINTDIEHIKEYLYDKYTKKAAPTYFKEFGIVKTGEVYKLPIDRDERKATLVLLLAAITVHGFQNNNFGLAYWTDIYTRYDALTAQAGSIDSTVTGKVSSKELSKVQIRKTMNALIHIIRGNYPDDYKSVLRTWGFQKEKY